MKAEPQVQRPRTNAAKHIIGRHLGKMKEDVRRFLLFVKPLYQFRDNSGGNALKIPQPDHLLRSLGRLLHQVHPLLQQVHCLIHIRKKALSIQGQRNLPALFLKQLYAQFPLQVPNGSTQAGLRDAQPFRCAGVVQRPG